MMNENMTSGKVISFIELLREHDIEIPIIQRDYAQGRSENKEIRLDFLEALKSKLTNGKEIKLDFIYGEIVDGVFQPLDGQQRLTTLFLLHWYAIAKEGEISEDISKVLSKFTYETRLSSKHFCRRLVNERISLVNNRKISDIIRDTSWFYLSWEQDPSISAMLNTLDDIQNLFEDELFIHPPTLWQRLTDQRLITFHYLNLPDLGLSDDLYIKMNARGKLLTPFENFKAQLQKHIEINRWEDGFDYTNKFSHKIDTMWTNLFWKLFGEKLDDAHIRFLATIVMFRIALGKGKTASERSSLLSDLNDTSDSRYLLQLIDKDTYEYIYCCYDLYANADKCAFDLSIDNINWGNHSCVGLLLKEMADDTSYTKKVMLFAQIEYLKRNSSFDRDSYIKWMRVIRNFVCFANITIKKTSSREDLLRDPDSFVGMINLINMMSNGCEDIYGFLSNLGSSVYTYRRDQMVEETKKAKYILSNPQLCDIIWKLEDLNLFRGRISYIFECIEEIFKDNDKNLNHNMIIIYNLFQRHFTDKEFEADNFNRAMLTIKVGTDYLYYDYWDSTWYAIYAGKRKFVVNLTDLNFYIYNDRNGNGSRKYLTQLIELLLTKSYQQILDDFNPPSDMPEWKIKLIKEDKWLKTRPSDFFAITQNNSDCFLLKSQRPLNMDGSIKII
jgi:hypothetical protein